MTFYAGSLRDEVYARLLVKRTANAFVFNNFTAAKTWRPHSTLESIASDVGGKVWVLCGVPGDIDAVNRNNAGKRFYAVMVAYQRVVAQDIDNLPLMDSLGEFMEQLETMCRKEIGDSSGNSGFAFTRLEYLKDENGIPYSFTMLRKALTFESYFTAYYNLVHT